MSSLEHTIEEVITEASGTKAPVPTAKGASSPDKDAQVKSTDAADKAGEATSKAKAPGGEPNKEKGDEVVLRLTHQFDHHTLPLEKIRVTSDEIKAAYKEISQEELDALREAANRIRFFHERQKQDSWAYEEEGIVLGQMVKPLEIVGIYVQPTLMLMKMVTIIVMITVRMITIQINKIQMVTVQEMPVMIAIIC